MSFGPPNQKPSTQAYQKLNQVKERLTPKPKPEDKKSLVEKEKKEEEKKNKSDKRCNPF